MSDPLDHFSGRIVRRGDESYDIHRYQYAFSSHAADGHMEPAAILYPSSTKDVLLAIEHAARKSLAIALRTGGHHHAGASSTSGPNLLLDLRGTYREFDWDPEHGVAWVGVSHSLDSFNALLGQRGLFVPHGQCGQVCLGGHVQTGGWGMLARSFGLFSDYIDAIKIITADGRERVVRRHGEQPWERDLFFATLGGSPGSFGVLTHVAVRPLHDRDHPHARGLKFLQAYSRERLKALLDLMAEVASDEDLARDYDFSVTVMGGAQVHLPFATSRGIDERMRVHHPEVYGRNRLLALPRAIIVYAQWANTGGAGQPFDPTFFHRIKAAASYGSAALPPEASGLARLANGLRPRSMMETWQNRMRVGPARVGLGSEAPVPMSELSRHWMFQNAREFNLPYVKRAYLSDSSSLRGWSEWVTDRFDALVAPRNGCKGFLQVQNMGGRHSQFRVRGLDGATAHSWRSDSTVCWLMECFYDERARVRESPRQVAIEWQQKNDEGAIERRIFSSEDRRVFFGPWGDTDLHNVWRHYFDSREKYDRLRAIKERVDPTGLFSPNAFGVGRPRGEAVAVREDSAKRPAVR